VLPLQVKDEDRGAVQIIVHTGVPREDDHSGRWCVLLSTACGADVEEVPRREPDSKARQRSLAERCNGHDA
jgi:hypothetical protein